MKIAILGWGSLIWDPRALKTIGKKWSDNGPTIKIEFSRISSDDRLTLVIDETNGSAVQTLFIISEFDDLAAGIENLRFREKTLTEKIGYIVKGKPEACAFALKHHPNAVAARRINQLFSDNPNYYSFRGGRVRRNTGLDQNRDFPVVAGIDVGGERRGFHLVSLQGAAIKSTWATRDAAEATAWCIEQGAKLVGVDAPSGWSKGIGGEFKSREAERSIHSEGFHIFFTPTKEAGSKRTFSQWMLNGERLYAELMKHYPLYGGQSSTPPECCFETYPYIAACGLANKRMSAKNKNQDRREIIRSVGIDPALLRNQDYVDAGICALVAYSVHIDYCTAYGHENEGFIFTPPLNYLA